MRFFLRLLALVAILAFTSIGWIVLGGVMSQRTGTQQMALYGRVNDLWGEPQQQRAPNFTFSWVEMEESETILTDEHGRYVRDATGRPYRALEPVTHTLAGRPSQSVITADLTLDQRRKGLMWYSLYDVAFDGTWTYTHDSPQSGMLNFTLLLPSQSGSYDRFVLVVDGEDVSARAAPQGGAISTDVPVEPGQVVVFQTGWTSRGMDSWSYQPTEGTSQIEDFSLTMTTDFADIDYPVQTMSPSTRTKTASGWELVWRFDRLVTGDGMGMVMPSRIQPGPLAAEMSFTAPISLVLFTAWITVLGLLRKVEIHPVNHLFLAAAFFSFHLLFGYSADRLPVEWAFALSSAVSVVLVVSYLRLVVGPRFALVEAGLAQLLYLVGFSLAHFWEGSTGLTLTVIGILTLFALMQLTGGIRWSDVLKGPQSPPPNPSIVG
jgi:hypothetical protein